MKTKFTLLFAAILMVGTAVEALADSFYPTNIIGPATAITGWPTNTAATNGIGQGTGGAINLNNQEWAAFNFQGDAYATGSTFTAGSIIVTLLRSTAQNPPGVTYGTNAFSNNTTNLLTCDWETYSNTVPPLVFTIPINTTNHINWFTNLDRWQVGGASWVGIAVITNSGASYFVTNMSAGLNKKIIPIRYP